MRNVRGLQKPQYVIIGNKDYSELKEEMEDLIADLGLKNGRNAMLFNHATIISDDVVLDLRNSRLEPEIKCKHQNQWFDRTVTGLSSTGDPTPTMGTFCVDCGERVN